MMREPVSIQRCAIRLGVKTAQIRAAITLGMVDAATGKVVPADVQDALVSIGTLELCATCGRPFAPPPVEES